MRAAPLLRFTLLPTITPSPKMPDTRSSPNEVGKRFEDQVAELYRLLGAEVIQNISVCNKRVDILASFRVPGSAVPHRVIVECKNHRRARGQNQLLMETQGLLSVARKSGAADSAEVVTSAPWGDEAKAFALRSGISLLTFAEKSASLLDFRPYLHSLVASFEKGDNTRVSEPPLGAYYIAARGEDLDDPTHRPVDIETYLISWQAETATQSQVAVFGEYGSGKTSLCRRLAAALAQQWLARPGSCRIPLLLNLKEFTREIRMESYIGAFLDEECNVANPRFRLFKAMNDAGLFLILCDGFDEMAARVDADVIESNLLEIEKLATAVAGRLVLTTRPEFFVSDVEESRSLKLTDNILSGRGLTYHRLRLLPWDDEQINDFLKVRVPLLPEPHDTWEHYRGEIGRIDGLGDLSKRPVLLEMIVKTLPTLVSQNLRINRPNLYETYLSAELKRQRITKQRRLLLDEATRFHLLEEFAILKEGGITYQAAMEIVDRQLRPTRYDLEPLTREFLTASFLIRKGSRYDFSHKSILEYLIARVLVREIEADEPRHMRVRSVPIAVIDFLMEMEPDIDVLFRWITRSRRTPPGAPVFLGGNALSLLCRLDPGVLRGKSIRGAVLVGCRLFGCDLTEVDASDATFRSADLTRCLIPKAFFESVLDFSQCLVTIYLPLVGPELRTSSEAIGLGAKIAHAVERVIGTTIKGRSIVRFPNGTVALALDVVVEQVFGLHALRLQLGRVEDAGGLAVTFEELRAFGVDHRSLVTALASRTEIL